MVVAFCSPHRAPPIASIGLQRFTKLTYMRQRQPKAASWLHGVGLWGLPATLWLRETEGSHKGFLDLVLLLQATSGSQPACGRPRLSVGLGPSKAARRDRERGKRQTKQALHAVSLPLVCQWLELKAPDTSCHEGLFSTSAPILPPATFGLLQAFALLTEAWS